MFNQVRYILLILDKKKKLFVSFRTLPSVTESAIEGNSIVFTTKLYFRKFVVNFPSTLKQNRFINKIYLIKINEKS